MSVVSSIAKWLAGKTRLPGNLWTYCRKGHIACITSHTPTTYQTACLSCIPLHKHNVYNPAVWILSEWLLQLCDFLTGCLGVICSSGQHYQKLVHEHFVVYYSFETMLSVSWCLVFCSNSSITARLKFQFRFKLSTFYSPVYWKSSVSLCPPKKSFWYICSFSAYLHSVMHH